MMCTLIPPLGAHFLFCDVISIRSVVVAVHSSVCLSVSQSVSLSIYLSVFEGLIWGQMSEISMPCLSMESLVWQVKHVSRLCCCSVSSGDSLQMVWRKIWPCKKTDGVILGSTGAKWIIFVNYSRSEGDDFLNIWAFFFLM